MSCLVPAVAGAMIACSYEDCFATIECLGGFAWSNNLV